VKPYTSWKQVAGYFDGDGTIGFSDLSNVPFKLGLSLIFTDQSIEQIANIKSFLEKHEIKTSNILRTKANAHIVVVSQYESVKKTLRLMLPHLSKKGNEAIAALEYYESKITGNELLTIFQKEVEAGRRERRPHRRVDVPFLYGDGALLMREVRKSRLRDALGRFRAKVTPEDFAAIREKHFDHNAKLQELMARYPQYSKETIRRILGRDRGYIGVKGIGRVDTTDTTIRDPVRPRTEHP
jgi:hypothetical protein